MRGQDDHTPFSSCADDVPCRSAAVWIHTCALQKALLVFDIIRYQSRIKLPFFHSFGLLQRIGMTLAVFVAVLDASSPFPAFAT